MEGMKGIQKRSEAKKHQRIPRPRVIIKFQDNTDLPYDETAENLVEKYKVGPWKQLQDKYRGIKLRPLISPVKASKIQELVKRGQNNNGKYEAPNFLTYFAVVIPEEEESEDMAEELTEDLSGWGSVHASYVESMRSQPPDGNGVRNPRSGNQGYLNAAPEGIDARYAWGVAGGDGSLQTLVDIEQGWIFDHEDLAGQGITMISGINDWYFYHGTSVLGIISAVDNDIGCLGITPELQSIRCVSQIFSDGFYTWYSTYEAIMDAITIMNPGDTLLLEAQANLYGYSNVPVEIEPAVFDAIRLATANNINVVEAAGNGGLDLDTVVNPWWGKMFDRQSAQFLDSGAILVGAGTSSTPHTRLGGSCYGSRIDCYAWGENVYTLTTDNFGMDKQAYTDSFDGTSSASAIIAGAALAVQGLVQDKYSQRITSNQMREILANSDLGTPSVDRIGVMPDLKSIIAAI